MEPETYGKTGEKEDQDERGEKLMTSRQQSEDDVGRDAVLDAGNVVVLLKYVKRCTE